MKINDIFTFIASNGVEVTAIVIDTIKDDKDYKWYLCYSQNRLFHYQIIDGYDKPLVNIIVEYCIIPEYDAMLSA